MGRLREALIRIFSRVSRSQTGQTSPSINQTGNKAVNSINSYPFHALPFATWAATCNYYSGHSGFDQASINYRSATGCTSLLTTLADFRGEGLGENAMTTPVRGTR